MFVVMRMKISRNLKKVVHITEDELHRYGEEIQKLTDSQIVRIDEIAKDKENEIMEI